GALVCTARGPRCDRCPLAARCAWVTAGRPEGAARSRRRQPFEGTDRQRRGMIMARVRRDGHATLTELLELDPGDPQRVRRCTASLAADGLARREGEVLQLPCAEVSSASSGMIMRLLPSVFALTRPRSRNAPATPTADGT